jgi:molecular chaperone GrpE
VGINGMLINNRNEDDFACGQKNDNDTPGAGDKEQECMNASDLDATNGCCRELAAAEESLTQWKDKYFRLGADFENLKRRAAKDEELYRYGLQVAVFKELLSIMDEYDRAVDHISGKIASVDAEGLIAIRKLYDNLFKKFGLEPMDNYDIFDPLYHEAIMQVQALDKEPGAIVVVLQRGYLMHGKVLRPAKVSIAV